MNHPSIASRLQAPATQGEIAAAKAVYLAGQSISGSNDKNYVITIGDEDQCDVETGAVGRERESNQYLRRGEYLHIIVLN